MSRLDGLVAENRMDHPWVQGSFSMKCEVPRKSDVRSGVKHENFRVVMVSIDGDIDGSA
jgi:hypothetical protein